MLGWAQRAAAWASRRKRLMYSARPALLINSVEISFMATGLPIWGGSGATMATPGKAPRSCALQHLYGVLQAAVHQVERAAERGDFVTPLHGIFRNVGLARADIAGERGYLLHRLYNEEVHQHVQQH